MSISRARPATEVLPAAEGTGHPGARDVAGLVFARLTVIPALLALSWLLPGVALLWAGQFRPVPVIVLAVLLSVPVVWLGLLAVPGLPPRAAAALPGEDRRTPWWPLAAVAVIAVAFLAQQVAYHGQFVIITRDPAAYFQFGTWLAKHGSLPVPTDAAVFGGTHGGALSFAGDATYQQDSGPVVLQFMAGLPMVLAGAIWVGGYEAALLMGPLLGTLAVVSFAGLAARLIGARWSPLAALVVAVSLPMQFTSRVTYSEPLAEILLLGGLALALDGLRDERAARASRIAAGLGGLLMGLSVLVRIDGSSDVLPIIPFCGALFVRRRPQAPWLAAGLAAGTAIGVSEGVAFSWPYLAAPNNLLLPLAAVAGAVVVLTAAGVWWFWRRRLPRWWGWLRHAALPAAFALVVAFGVRPHFQHTWGAKHGVVVRTYQELSLHWVDWYLGLPVIFAATVGAGLLARRCLQGRAGHWALPLMMLSWATVVFLYDPAITPDQPWASRRMVPEVIPAFVLLAVWAIACGTAWLSAARSGRQHLVVRAAATLRATLVTVCVLAVTLPAVVANWGLGLSVSNGIRVTADGLAEKRDYQDELYAMEKLCSALPANAAVIFVGSGSEYLLQSIRAMCGVPVAAATPSNSQGKQVLSAGALANVVKSAAASVQRAGRVPVILTMGEGGLRPYRATGEVQHIFALHTTKDPGVLYGVPKIPFKQVFDVWMWRPSG